MFKKTLLATALSALTFGAGAATLAITGNTVSQEGAVNDASVPVPSAVATLGAEYTINDTITFTISGADFDAAASTPVLTAALAGGDTATLGLLSSDGSAVTFRITAHTDGGVDGVLYTGGTFTLSGMVMTPASVVDATGDISLTYSALTNTGLDLDTVGTNTAVSSTVVAQLASSLTKAANGIIDVNFNRLQFTAADEGVADDDIVLTITEAAVTVADAVYTGAVHTVVGDFSWMDTGADGAVSAAEAAAATTLTGATDDTCTATVNATMDIMTVTCTDGGGNDVEAHTIRFDVSGQTLPTQTMTYGTVVNYNDNNGTSATKQTVADGAAAGAWTLNGSQVSVPYMPYGTSISQIIYAANEGNQTGDSQVDITLEDGTTANCALGSIGPGTTKLTGPVKTCVEAAVGAGVAQKVALVITTNVPAGDIEMYTAYNVNTDGGNGDRVTVPNSSTHGLAATID